MLCDPSCWRLCDGVCVGLGGVEFPSLSLTLFQLSLVSYVPYLSKIDLIRSFDRIFPYVGLIQIVVGYSRNRKTNTNVNNNIVVENRLHDAKGSHLTVLLLCLRCFSLSL